MLFIFAVFFFLWFLGILHGMLRRAEGEEETGLPSVALAGGLALVALKLVGCRLRLTTRRLWTVSTTSRRMLSWPSCHRNSTGSMVALHTGVLPRWLAWSGLMVALILLLHFLIPLGSLLALLWFVMVAVLMLAGGVGSTDGPRRYTVRW